MLNLSAIFSVLYLYVEQFVHVGLPFVHRGIEKIKYSVILSTYHGKQIKLSVIVRQLRRGGENDGQEASKQGTPEKCPSRTSGSDCYCSK